MNEAANSGITDPGPLLWAFLRCPLTGSPLTSVGAETVACINQRIVAGEVENRTGITVREPLEAALANGQRKCLVPVRGGIVDLQPDELIDWPAGI